MKIEIERLRIEGKPATHENECPFVLILCAKTSKPDLVLRRIKEVMLTVLDHSNSWPKLEEWQQLLPNWFIDEFAAEKTAAELKEEARIWRQAKPEERLKMELETKWTLTEWLSWMHPDERPWHWWDSEVKENQIKLRIEVDDFVPLEALECTILNCGADEVTRENC